MTSNYFPLSYFPMVPRRSIFRLLVSVAILAFPFGFSSSAVASSICDAVSGNLIADCGFESGTPSITSTGFNPYWTLSATAVFTTVVPASPGNYYVNSGNQSAAFGDFNPITLTSTPFADKAGVTYTFSFYLYGDEGGAGTNSFSAAVDGITLFPAFYDPTQSFQLYSTTFVGTGGSNNTVSFTAFDDNDYLFLDDVVVAGPPSATPEPSSLLLLATGALGLAAIAGRRLRILPAL